MQCTGELKKDEPGNRTAKSGDNYNNAIRNYQVEYIKKISQNNFDFLFYSKSVYTVVR